MSAIVQSQSMHCVQLVLVALFLVQAHSQDACERLTIDDLGSTDMLASTGLVSDILAPDGELTAFPQVRLIAINIVCEAQHMTEDRYRYTSVVATFNCFYTDPRVSDCHDSSVVNTQQFDLGCADGTWSPVIFSLSSFSQTAVPTATLETNKDTHCAICLSPDHTIIQHLSLDVPSNDTHCLKCDNCSKGLQRCLTVFTCCNYFHQRTCVFECPKLFPLNDNFECVPVDCGGLPDPVNGTVAVSNTTYMSNASYECDTGFVLEGESTRTCLSTGEWSGDTPTCTLCSSVIPNCEECTKIVEANSTLYNCSRCSSGFKNQNGMDCVLNAIGCGRECIIGITLSVLGLLVISGIIAVSSSFGSQRNGRGKYSIRKARLPNNEPKENTAELNPATFEPNDNLMHHYVTEEGNKTLETPHFEEPDYDYPQPQKVSSEPATSNNIAYGSLLA